MIVIMAAKKNSYVFSEAGSASGASLFVYGEPKDRRSQGGVLEVIPWSPQGSALFREKHDIPVDVAYPKLGFVAGKLRSLLRT